STLPTVNDTESGRRVETGGVALCAGEELWPEDPLSTGAGIFDAVVPPVRVGRASALAMISLAIASAAPWIARFAAIAPGCRLVAPPSPPLFPTLAPEPRL